MMCWEMICCPLPGGWTQGSGVPDAAFDVNLLLHLSRSVHLPAHLEQVNEGVCTSLLTLAMK